MLIPHLNHRTIPLNKPIPFPRAFIRLQYLIHTTLPEQMPLNNFPTFVKPGLTSITIIGRKYVGVVVESIFLDHIAIEIIIEPLNFLFIHPLIKPMCVPAAIYLLNQIPLLFHQLAIVLIKNYRMNGAVLWRQVMLLPIFLRIERCVALYRILQRSLFRIVYRNGLRPESLLLVYSTTHAASVHLLFTLSYSY